MNSIKYLEIIDWDKCLYDLGCNDSDFLIEIMSDLIEEAEQCRKEVIQALLLNDFTKINREIHKVKGSALYMGCEQLLRCTMEIKDAAKEKKADAIYQWLYEFEEAVNRLSVVLNEKKEELSHGEFK